MSDYLLTSVMTAAVAVGVYGWLQNRKAVAPDTLERELKRVQGLPGAEPLLGALKGHTRITPRLLAKFSHDLDDLEQMARVAAAHAEAKRQLWAPIAERFAREIVDDLRKARRQEPTG